MFWVTIFLDPELCFYFHTVTLENCHQYINKYLILFPYNLPMKPLIWCEVINMAIKIIINNHSCFHFDCPLYDKFQNKIFQISSLHSVPVSVDMGVFFLYRICWWSIPRALLFLLTSSSTHHPQCVELFNPSCHPVTLPHPVFLQDDVSSWTMNLNQLISANKQE